MRTRESCERRLVQFLLLAEGSYLFSDLLFYRNFLRHRALNVRFSESVCLVWCTYSRCTVLYCLLYRTSWSLPLSPSRLRCTHARPGAICRARCDARQVQVDCHTRAKEGARAEE